MSESSRRKKRGNYPYKRDTGIARLPSGDPIREETRDILNKKMSGGSLPVRQSGNIESSTFNADGRSTRELQDLQWSGLRRNEISRQMELWMMGEILERLSLADVDRNPGILATAMEKHFGLTAHTIEMDVGNPGVRVPHIFKSPH